MMPDNGARADPSAVYKWAVVTPMRAEWKVAAWLKTRKAAVAWGWANYQTFAVARVETLGSGQI